MFNTLLEHCLAAGAGEMGLELDRPALAMFSEYYRILSEENKKFNLTSIEGEKEVAVKHFLDSLSCISFLENEGPRMIDLGTGGGFPGLPVKIYRPRTELVLVDSTRKKVDFLVGLIGRLGLTGVQARWDRAEKMGRSSDFREKADVVASRAVAPLNVLAELCLPLVRLGGCFLSMKGPGLEEELAAAGKAVDLLGGKVERVEKILLPLEGPERNIILIRKEKSTPDKYPRREGIPVKRPIV